MVFRNPLDTDVDRPGVKIGTLIPSKEGLEEVYAGPKYGDVTQEKYNELLQSGALGRGQQAVELTGEQLVQHGKDIASNVGEAWEENVGGYIPDIKPNESVQNAFKIAQGILGKGYEWGVKPTVDATMNIIDAPATGISWASRKLDPSGRGIGKAPLAIAETAVTMGGGTLKNIGKKGLKLADDAAEGAGKILKGNQLQSAYSTVGAGDNVGTVARNVGDDTFKKNVFNFTDADPIHQIRNLDKSKITIRKAENIRKAELIKSGELKPAPKYKLKTSKEAEEYYGLTSKELKEKYGFRYNQYGESGSGDFRLKSLKLNQLEIDKRNLSIINVTGSTDIVKKGNKKWSYINKKLGMEAHHIIPIHVSNKLKDLYMFDRTGKPIKNGLENWTKRVAKDAKDGIFHGNNPKNIVAVRGSTKEPLTTAGKRSQIYHRKGQPEFDNPGYHKIEGSIKWDTSTPDLIDLRPYRDIMANQQRLRLKANKFLRSLGTNIID